MFTLNVVVKLFASYKEKAGTSEIRLELPEGITVGEFAREVLARHPNIIKDPSRLVVAVNDEFRDHDYILSDGDEAALIPPVSGGLE